MAGTEATNLYFQAFSCCADAMLLVDEQGRIRELNPAAERLFDRSAAAARGQALDQMLHPPATAANTPAPIGALVEQALRERAPRELPKETALLREGAPSALLSGSVSPVVDDQGACHLALLILRDVTEQAREARALHERQARLLDALDTLDAGIVMFDPDERFVFCNRTYKEMYPQGAALATPGTSYEEILRTFCRNGGHLRSGLSEEGWVGERLAAHRGVSGSREHQLAERWIRISDSRTRDGSVVSLRTDITAFKATELALRRERQLSRMVIDSDPNLIFVKDKDGRFLLANKAIAALYGTTVEAMQGQIIGALRSNTVESNEYARVDEEVLQTLRSVSKEHSFTRSSGEVRWFSTTKVPLIEPDGATHILGISLDITERKANDELIAQSFTELKRRKAELHDKLSVIERQQDLIQALSMPILQVAHRVLAVPLIGALDDAREGELTGKLLTEIVRSRSRYAIIDVTGVDAMDAGMASRLVRLVSAIRLLGAQGILTGIRPGVAQSLCALGADLLTITTRATLRDGLEMCMRAGALSPALP